MTILEEIAAERERQKSGEGWTEAHDDKYVSGELPSAAACYALAGDKPVDPIAFFWPWDQKWWKPTTHRRNLVKAAAVIVAEIERVDRLAKRRPA